MAQPPHQTKPANKTKRITQGNAAMAIAIDDNNSNATQQ
jgi:hypothetical protein